MRALLIGAGILALSACGQTNPPSPQNEMLATGKTEGPPANTLSHEQLQAALSECIKYGKMDDPRVNYSGRYCSAIMSAHLSEGYAKSTPSNVDPSINKLH